MFLFFSLTGINILCLIHNYIHMYNIYKKYQMYIKQFIIILLVKRFHQLELL